MSNTWPQQGLATPNGRRFAVVRRGRVVMSVVALCIFVCCDFQHSCEAICLAGDTAYPIRKAVFESIYQKHLWGVNAQGVGHSGPGSTMASTKIYRVFLQDFLADHDIRSVIDAGCGDWEFSQAIDWSGIDYFGCDIVEPIISENKKRYGAQNIHFFTCDIVTTELPTADLLIVKDVLQHLSYRDINQFLKQLPKYKHVLIINDVDPASLSVVNRDIKAGEHRPLDLTRPPFSMPMSKLLAFKCGIETKLVLHQAR
jgi:SAM-dependent methyltransferase